MFLRSILRAKSVPLQCANKFISNSNINSFSINSTTRLVTNPNINFNRFNSEETTKSDSPISNSPKSDSLIPEIKRFDPKHVPEKIQKLIDDVLKMNLLELKIFSDKLREQLGIKDTQIPLAMVNTGGYAMGMVPPMGMTPPTPTAPPVTPGAPTPAATSPEQPKKEEKKPVQKDKPVYNVKILSFDPAKKLAIIKELRTLIPDISLVKAKQLVEEAPSIVKEKALKDNANIFKEKLEAVGAKISLE